MLPGGIQKQPISVFVRQYLIVGSVGIKRLLYFVVWMKYAYLKPSIVLIQLEMDGGTKYLSFF